MSKHLFVIPSDTIESVSIEECAATIAGLKELGLYHLPYKQISIRIPQQNVVCIKSEDPQKQFPYIPWKRRGDGKWTADFNDAHYVLIEDISIDSCGNLYLCSDGDLKWKPYRVNAKTPCPQHQELIRDLLITLLATKNAVKSTTVNKLARLGIGKHKSLTKSYAYVTTISLPHTHDMDTEGTPGKAKAAHLRRGHKRDQRFGPHYSCVRSIWIDPVFVNADADFVNTRERYNVSL